MAFKSAFGGKREGNKLGPAFDAKPKLNKKFFDKKPLTHYITSLVAGLKQYYKLAEPIVLTGDYEVEAWAHFVGKQIIIAADSASWYGYVRIYSNGVIAWRPSHDSGTEVTSPPNSGLKGKLIKISVKRDGNTGVISLNGNVVFTKQDIPTGDLLINTIGMQKTLYSTGSINDIQFKEGARGLVAHYAISKNNWLTESSDLTSVLLNSANDSHHATAVNITNGDVEVFEKQDNGNLKSIKNIATKAEVTLDGITRGSIHQVSVSDALTAGETYLLEMDVIESSGTGNFGFSQGGTVQDNKVVFLYTANSTGSIKIFCRPTNRATFKNISVKEIIEVVK